MGLGDPMDPFVRNNTAEIDDLLSPDWAAAMRALTSDAATQPVTVYGPPWNPLAYPDGQGPPPEDHGTTHLSVVDGRRNAVALTSTINTACANGKGRRRARWFFLGSLAAASVAHTSHQLAPR